MFRRRERLTPEQKADLRWERMQSQPKTMGMVGIFNDLNPGAKHAEAQIAYEREAFLDQGSEGDGPAERPSTFTFTLRPAKPADPAG